MRSAEAITPDSVQVLLNELKMLQREQQENPANPLPPYHCGLIYAQLGDHEAAVRSYQQAVELKPDLAPAYYNMGLSFGAFEKFPEAEEAYRQALRLSPGDSEAWANLGALLETQGKLEQALDAFRHAIQIDPDEGAARQRAAGILMAEGRLDEAAPLLEEGLENDPQDFESLHSLGLIAFRQERLEEALELYEQAVALAPNFAMAFNNLGNLHLKLGSEVKAVEAYRKALAADPKDPTIWFNLGDFFFLRDHPEAEKCLARVVELDRGDMEAWEMLRQWYRRHPHYSSWKSVLNVMRVERPDDVSLLAELSQVHEHLGEHEEAVAALKAVAALEPGNAETRTRLAVLALKQGQYLEAYAQLNLVETAEPDVLDMSQYLGQVLLYHDHPEEAETCFIKVISHRDWQTDAWQFLGNLAFQRGQWELSLERFKRCEELNANDQALWWSLSQRFAELGDYGKAAECLDHLSGLLRYLPDEWESYAPIYQRAGRSEEFLGRLEQLQWEFQLGGQYWQTLAGLFRKAGLAERAVVCLQRMEHPESQDPPEGGEAPQELERIDQRLDKYLSPLHRENAGKKREPALTDGATSRHDPPQDAVGWRMAGDEHYSEGLLEKALEAYQKSLDLDHNDFTALFNEGKTHFRMGRPNLAENAFRGALTQDANSAKGWYNLGCSQEAQKKETEAIASFEKAVRCDPHFAPAWNWLGVLRARLGRVEDARIAYMRSIANDSKYAKAWHNLGVLYRSMGEGEKSAYHLKRAAQLGGVEEEAGVVAPSALPQGKVQR